MGRTRALFAVALLAAAVFGVAADQREDPMDIIIALDKSLSMVEEIGAVKQYAATSIVDDLVIPGDLLIIVAFYGKAEVLVSTVISDGDSRDSIKKAIAGVHADGRWTDIGNALDELRRQLESHAREGIPKYLLLITDGKPEPPPGSKYWSPDGSFTHDFLANTRTIQKEGWKVQVLGLGSAADARELAEKLSGIYTQVPGNPTVEQLTATTREFLGSMAIQGKPTVSAIGRGGMGTIRLTVKSSGYESPKTVVLTGIRLEAAGELRENILPQRTTLEMPASGVTEVALPIVLSPELPPGRYTGTFDLSFDSVEQLIPTVLTLDFRVNTVLRNNLAFVLAGAVLVAAGIALLILLLLRRAAGGRVTFRLAVTEVPLRAGHDVFILGFGDELFLEEEADRVRLTLAKRPSSIARLYAGGERGAPTLALEVLDTKGFLHPGQIPASLLAAEIVMLTGRGRRLHLRFEAVPEHA
jgi:Mg-chelatase subunit ChlD